MSTPFTDYKKLSIAERIQLVEDIWDSITAEAPSRSNFRRRRRRNCIVVRSHIVQTRPQRFRGNGCARSFSSRKPDAAHLSA